MGLLQQQQKTLKTMQQGQQAMSLFHTYINRRQQGLLSFSAICLSDYMQSIWL